MKLENCYLGAQRVLEFYSKSLAQTYYSFISFCNYDRNLSKIQHS